MWTAAKLVAALLFAGVGYVAGTFAHDTLPGEMVAPWLAPSIALIGLWQGWYVMGSHAHEGAVSAMGNGLRTGVQIAVFGVLFYALREMFIRSSRLRYDDPGEAVIAALELFIEYFLQILTVPVIASLVIGGIVAGWITSLAARAWK